ncbi:hypothetical protein F2Q69_00038502 [Brassica cretica]|uniref:Uncharacterized protein n=2 Tax=Brassica cretica TaxID=69181 RepID=A0ABQ7B7S2_BRACR|nr:hypothetical protein DY000_02043203 [Brassica cretica]KAF3603600.1 hypothetical protein F2Q69_00038502 [Brassica cretica]
MQVNGWGMGRRDPLPLTSLRVVCYLQKDRCYRNWISGDKLCKESQQQDCFQRIVGRMELSTEARRDCWTFREAVQCKTTPSFPAKVNN